MLFTMLLFPFVRFIPIEALGSDTQIHCLIIPMMALFLAKKTKLPRIYFLLFIPIAVATFFLIKEPINNFAVITRWMQYNGLFLGCAGSYILLKSDNKKILNEKYLLIIFLIYFFVGLIQTFFYKEFLNFLVSSTGMRSSVSRGVTSLSNEPSFYADNNFLFFLLFNSLNLKYKKTVSFLAIFQTLFFARSSLGLCLFAVYFFLNFIFRFNLKKLAIYSIGLILIIISFNLFLKNTRIYTLSNLLIQNPQLILKDNSANKRSGGLIQGIKGSIDNNFLPNGFEKWKYYSTEQNTLENENAILVPEKGGSRIGSTLFELGFFSIPIFIFLFIIISKNRSISVSLVYFFSLLSLFVSSLPYINSLLCCTISYIYYHSTYKTNENIKT